MSRNVWSIHRALGWFLSALGLSTGVVAAQVAPYELRGVLIDETDGLPVANQRLFVRWDRPVALGVAPEVLMQTDVGWTDAQGRFAIPTYKPPQTPFRIWIPKGPQTPAYLTPVIATTPPDLLEVRVPAEREWIAGRVTNSAGQPVSMAWITVRSKAAPRSGTLVYEGRTDADGTFVAGPLLPGVYDVHCRPDAHSALSTFPPRVVENVATKPLLEAGVDPIAIVFSPEAEPSSGTQSGGDVTVHLVDDTGTPIERANVRARVFSADFRWGSASPTTLPVNRVNRTVVFSPAGDGRYRLGYAPAGSYVIVAWTEDGFGWWGGELSPSSGDAATSLTVVVRRGSGRIVGSALNADGTPARDALTVRCETTLQTPVGEHPVVFVWRVVPGPDGRFVAPPLPAAHYRVILGGNSEFDAAAASVDHPGDRDVSIELIRPAAPPPVPYEGVVADEAGRPVQGARVTFWANASTPLEPGPAITDAQGRWRLAPQRPAGSSAPGLAFAVTVEHESYGTAYRPKKAYAPQELSRIVMEPPLEVRLRLYPKDDRTRRALALGVWQPQLFYGGPLGDVAWEGQLVESVEPAPDALLEFVFARAPRATAQLGRVHAPQWKFALRDVPLAGEALWSGGARQLPLQLPADPNRREMAFDVAVQYEGPLVTATRTITLRLLDADTCASIGGAALMLQGVAEPRRLATGPDGSLTLALENVPVSLIPLRGTIAAATAGVLEPISPGARQDALTPRTRLRLDVERLTDGEVVEVLLRTLPPGPEVMF